MNNGSDFQTIFYSIPKVTRTFIVSVFATTFAISYVKALPVFYYFALDYDKIFSFEVKLCKIIPRSGV
jgi:hypothetical protein